MILSAIKKIIAPFAKKRRPGSAYQAKGYPFCSIPGEQGIRQQKRKWQLSRIKKLLRSRKKRKNEGYGQSTKSFGLKFKRGILVVLVVVTGVLILSGGIRQIVKGLASLSFFQISKLAISGTNALSTDQLREQAKIVLHQTSLIGMETDEIEALLIKNPWIAVVEVERIWPSTVAIKVKENVPVALLHTTGPDSDQLYYINKKGIPFIPVTAGASVDFPVITGLSDVEDASVRRSSLAEVLIFLKKAGNNDPHLPVQAVSEVHVNPDGKLVVYLVEYPFPIFFGNGNTKRKYNKLLRVLQALYKKQRGEEIISSVEYIRMDYFNDKVLVAQNGSG